MDPRVITCRAFRAIRFNLRKGNAAEYLTSGGLADVLRYPGVFYFNDANELWLRGNNANVRVVTGDIVDPVIAHPADAAGSRLLTAQLSSAGMWELFVTTWNGDHNHSRSAKFLACFDAAGSSDLANIQKIGSDAAHGSDIAGLTCGISLSGLIKATATTGSVSATVNMRIRAEKVGAF